MSQVTLEQRRRKFATWESCRKNGKHHLHEDIAILNLLARFGATEKNGTIIVKSSDLIRMMKVAFKEAAKDQKRLDWIERNCEFLSYKTPNVSYRYYWIAQGNQTYREWIDQQRAEFPETTK